MKGQLSLEFMVAMAALAAAMAAAVSLENAMSEKFARSSAAIAMQAEADLASAEYNRDCLDAGANGFSVGGFFDGGALLHDSRGSKYVSGAMQCERERLS